MEVIKLRSVMTEDRFTSPRGKSRVLISCCAVLLTKKGMGVQIREWNRIFHTELEPKVRAVCSTVKLSAQHLCTSVSYSVAEAGVQWAGSQFTTTSASQVQVIFVPQTPKQLGLQMHTEGPVLPDGLTQHGLESKGHDATKCPPIPLLLLPPPSMHARGGCSHDASEKDLLQELQDFSGSPGLFPILLFLQGASAKGHMPRQPPLPSQLQEASNGDPARSDIYTPKTRVQCHDLNSLQPPPTRSDSSDSPTSAFQIAVITGAHHHIQLIVLYF
ncbi:hypothetical protein AAY473_020086 [Plecturocebus cupreus]